VEPTDWQEFDSILSGRKITGSVLEVGAVRRPSLLRLRSLREAREKIGINLRGPSSGRGFKIVKGDANCMDCFEDGRFDVVLCNAMLEHDKCFWKTMGEIRRVTKQGGLVVIGVPGFMHYQVEKLKPFLRKVYTEGVPREGWLHMFFTSTITYQVHTRRDYYRFSERAVKEAILEGFENVETRVISTPPMIIGFGTKI
jgi:ubiquinone/menaquinone biosynthesis C-methylase UbiE